VFSAVRRAAEKVAEPAKTGAFGVFPNVQRDNELFPETALAIVRFHMQEFAPIS
jgi:hypothetical protein